MIKVGITGQSGFVGTHLAAKLNSMPNKYSIIPFEDSYFEDEQKLRNFVRQCDVIVHLAAMMRSPIEGIVYETNMRLVNQVIDAMNAENETPDIFFASSIQENNGSEYARCKLDGKALFIEWAKEHHAGFGCTVFPNLFGPGARPNSHSFIATFCYKLTHGEEPKVLVDNTVSLKYIHSMLNDMIPFMERVIENKSIEQLQFEPDYILKVTEVLSILEGFKKEYLCDGVTPVFHSPEEKDLFETFVTYVQYNL